jgi:hypothetical protein
MGIGDDTSEEDEEPIPTCAQPAAGSGWPTTFRMPQRWLVAAISLLFLYWIWSDDRTNNKSNGTTGPSEPVVV